MYFISPGRGLAVLKKAAHGEGSRGGKILGHTRTGKPIYEGRRANHPGCKGFTPADHYRAQWHHDQIARDHFGNAEGISEALDSGGLEDLSDAERAKDRMRAHKETEAGYHYREIGEEHEKAGDALVAQGHDPASESNKPEIIGLTRSGKHIFEAGSSKHYGYGQFKRAHKDFSPDDHRDAAAAHRARPSELTAYSTRNSDRSRAADQHDYFAAHPDKMARRKGTGQVI